MFRPLLPAKLLPQEPRPHIQVYTPRALLSTFKRLLNGLFDEIFNSWFFLVNVKTFLGVCFNFFNIYFSPEG